MDQAQLAAEQDDEQYLNEDAVVQDGNPQTNSGDPTSQINNAEDKSNQGDNDDEVNREENLSDGNENQPATQSQKKLDHQNDDYNMSIEELRQEIDRNEVAPEEEQNDTQVYQTTGHQDNMPGEENNIYLEHNKRIVTTFLQKYGIELEKYFSEYSKDQSDTPLVICSEIPLLLRVGFYINNITFHETRQEQEELFNKPNSYKKIMVYIEQFLGLFKPGEKLESYKFCYADFLKFIEYLVTTDKELFLRQRDENEYQSTNIGSLASKQVNLSFELQSNIEKYEKLLQECETDQERLILSNTLNALKLQLDQLNISTNQIASRKSTQYSKLKSVQMSVEQSRQKNLCEIFTFYSRQQYVQGACYTFDRIMHETNVLNIAKFMLFVQQFNLLNYNKNLTKRSIPHLFKKTSSNFKELSLDEFKIMLEKISLLMFEGESSSYVDKVEELYKYIGLDDPTVYRKKFKLLNPPFNIKDKEGFRLLPKDIGRQIKLRRIEQKQLQDLKQKKIEDKIKILKDLDLSQETSFKKQVSTQQQPSGYLTQKSVSHIKLDRYSQKLSHQSIQGLPQSSKVTWSQLQQQSYTDLKQLQTGKFNPEDLFEQDNDKEDQYYLKQYNLNSEKESKMKKIEENKVDQEKYGNLQEKIRPTQKYLIQKDPSYDPTKKFENKNLHRSHHYSDDEIDFDQQNQQPPSSKNQPISNQYLKRAQQIDQDLQKKQQQLMQKVLDTQHQQVKRGLQSLSRKQ